MSQDRRKRKVDPALGQQSFLAMPLGLTERDFDLLHLVGQGAFGKVFTARNRDTGHVYALKVAASAPVAAEGAMQVIRKPQRRTALACIWSERNVLATVIPLCICPLLTMLCRFNIASSRRSDSASLQKSESSWGWSS